MNITLTAEQLAENIHSNIRLTPEQEADGVTVADVIAEKKRLYFERAADQYAARAMAIANGTRKVTISSDPAQDEEDGIRFSDGPHSEYGMPYPYPRTRKQGK